MKPDPNQIPSPASSAPDVSAQQAQAQNAAVAAGDAQRKKALAAFGRSDTILTGPRGATVPLAQQTGARKTLLGL